MRGGMITKITNSLCASQVTVQMSTRKKKEPEKKQMPLHKCPIKAKITTSNINIQLNSHETNEQNRVEKKNIQKKKKSVEVRRYI